MRLFAANPNSTEKIDPLYVIFEQHLYNFEEASEERAKFIAGVVVDYVKYLRKNGLIVPRAFEQFIVEELGAQVKVMLLKKIYGCPNVAEFQKQAPRALKKAARAKYKRVVGA